MTEEQKKYYNAMKKLGSKKPQKPIPRPTVRRRRVSWVPEAARTDTADGRWMFCTSHTRRRLVLILQTAVV